MRKKRCRMDIVIGEAHLKARIILAASRTNASRSFGWPQPMAEDRSVLPA
jgi:hypothetical protein